MTASVRDQEIVHRSHKPIGIVAGEIVAPGKLDRSDAGIGGAHLGQRFRSEHVGFAGPDDQRRNLER